MAHPKAYTDEEKAFIRKHWATETVDWIGEQLGRGGTSVRQHAARMGLPKKPSGRRANDKPDFWTEERVDRLTMMWNLGYTAAVIAAEMGPDITRNVVIGKAHRLGLQPHSLGRPAVVPPSKMDLGGPRAKTCQWPIGHPGQDDFRFCGEAVATDKPHRPYCPHHCAVAYRAASKVETLELTAVKKRLKRVA